MVNKALKKQTLSRRLILRASLKVLSTVALMWLTYILTSGFFGVFETSKSVTHRFNIASMSNDSVMYFKTERRELMVVKSQNGLGVFWANDPLYGCRLEFFDTFIKPVCIDIKYDLKGYSTAKNQQLASPEFEISSAGELVVY